MGYLVICRQIYYGLVSYGQSQTATNLSSALNIPRAQKVRDATLCLLDHLTYVHVQKHAKFKRQKFCFCYVSDEAAWKRKQGLWNAAFFILCNVTDEVLMFSYSDVQDLGRNQMDTCLSMQMVV